MTVNEEGQGRHSSASTGSEQQQTIETKKDSQGRHTSAAGEENQQPLKATKHKQESQGRDSFYDDSDES